jgi:hypothetical protein
MNQTVYAVRGDTASLSCKVFKSDHGVKRHWNKENKKLRGGSDRIWAVQDELRIRNADAQDSGNFTCLIKNARGEVQVTYSLVVRGNQSNTVC